MSTPHEIIADDAGYKLVALDRPQLEAAHAKMIDWAKARRDRVDVDLDVEGTALEVAVKNGWLTAPHERRLNVLAKQRTFYDKIIQALEAGFAIVPNFQMDIFAIRTKARSPRGNRTTSWRHDFQQSAQLLPAGEGEYQNPRPTVFQETRKESDGKGGAREITEYWPDDEFTDVAFPVALAKPALMSRVGEAMALKLFDEIGVAMDAGTRPTFRRGDPILLGRLVNPRSGRPSLTFFLGWYFDPSRL